MPEDGDETTVCPACDSHNIAARSAKPTGRPGIERWYCRDCEERFDEPNRRPVHPDGDASPSRGLAKTLDRADPDDLVTDGGGWIVTSEEDQTAHPKLSPEGRPHWSDCSTMGRDILAILVAEDAPTPASHVADALAGAWDKSLDQDYVADQTDALVSKGLAIHEDGQYRATSEGRYVARSYAQWLLARLEARQHGGAR